ncbi:MAG: methyltransferase domain-containing protein [Devosia sp.]|nr:methyltransferase domain-containing protein [Devosia sp.]
MFDNKTFWNLRYTDHPWIGSGPGSRGISADYKAELIARVIRERAVRTVVDVGCGDCCWLTHPAVTDCFDGKGYLGLDLAEAVVEQNRRRFAGMNFATFDLLTSPLPMTFDLVICLDVLIHQVEQGAFELATGRLLAATRHCALISCMTEPAAEPVDPPVLTAGAEARQAAFSEMLRARQDSFPKAPTISVDVVSLIGRLDPGVTVTPVGRFSRQIAYLITRP